MGGITLTRENKVEYYFPEATRDDFEALGREVEGYISDIKEQRSREIV